VGKFLGILVSSIIALAMVEAAARLVLGSPTPLGVLMFSENPFQAGGGGSMKFVPNREIRALSVFGARREFDVRFETNNLGLVDAADYPLPPKPRNIALAGDSYTAGYHGGRPWVPGLRELLPGANVYNLGVTGTGFVQFADLLADFAASVAIDEVVLIAISSDISRRSWQPFVRENRLSLCSRDTPEAKCLAKNSNILLIEGDGSAPSLNARIDAHYAAMPKVGWRRYLSRHTYVGRLFHSRTWKRRSKGLDKVEIPPFTVAALQRIRKQFHGRPARLIHLPEKREVLAGAFSTDLEAAAKTAGFSFTNGLGACNLTVDDFFPRDPHPNARGYEKIRLCVSRALK